MEFRVYLLCAACIALAVAAGCTSASAPPAAPVPPSVSPVPTVDGCTGDVCSALPPQSHLKPAGSVRIEASPSRYSPLMSSTPGIGIRPVASGFNTSDAMYSWNASYGRFLSWNSPDYAVHLLETGVENHGEKIYWTFTDPPASSTEPVFITVTALDPVTRAVLASGSLVLDWDGNNSVTVRDTP